MGIKEIPRAFVYTCDGCGTTHTQENASGHYTDSRPPHWSRLRLAQHAYDYQGAAVADGSVERLLCSQCTEVVSAAINSAIERMKVG